jgi:hypothetical protein
MYVEVLDIMRQIACEIDTFLGRACTTHRTNGRKKKQRDLSGALRRATGAFLMNGRYKSLSSIALHNMSFGNALVLSDTRSGIRR